MSGRLVQVLPLLQNVSGNEANVCFVLNADTMPCRALSLLMSRAVRSIHLGLTTAGNAQKDQLLSAPVANILQRLAIRPEAKAAVHGALFLNRK